MKKIHGRVSAEVDGDFVVFLIGMHVNRWSDLRRWGLTFTAMVRAVRELQAQPELGLLRAEGGLFFGGPAFVQYWRSYEQLEAYARNTNAVHLPAWRAFNKAARTSDSVGIYHETYRVTAGNFEVMYNHMPEVGLLAASGSRPLDRSSTSALRMGDRSKDQAPVEAPN
ncbi:MAG: DUF4188 domain-containing protein [Actinomycetota bacterium]|nr:DUF4188 domain-containing protein [Actinomycetota bacterium]